MNSIYEKISHCRVCESKDLELLLSLGMQPLTGVFIKPEEPDPVATPLDLIFCNDCKFVQLAHTVKSDLMYKSYWYRSGINQTMKDHLKGIIREGRPEARLRNTKLAKTQRSTPSCLSV